MKKIKLSLWLMVTCVTSSIAGGSIIPVSDYVVEDEKKAAMIEVSPLVILNDEKKIATPNVSQIVILNEGNETNSTDENETISSFYIGAGITFTSYDSRCYLTGSRNESGTGICDGQSTKIGVLIRGGYDFNEYIGAEARGIISGNLTHIGLFAKPMYNINEDFNIYALAGVAKTTTSTNFRNSNVLGLAFGIGLEYDFSDEEEEKEIKYDREFDGLADQEKGFGLFIDYEKLYYKSNAPTLDALSAGVTYDF